MCISLLANAKSSLARSQCWKQLPFYRKAKKYHNWVPGRECCSSLCHCCVSTFHSTPVCVQRQQQRLGQSQVRQRCQKNHERRIERDIASRYGSVMGMNSSTLRLSFPRSLILANPNKLMEPSGDKRSYCQALGT